MQHKLTRLTALMLAVIMSFSMLLVPVQAASFKDVPENAWYKAAVDYVSEKGWMAGVGDMTFAPTQDVTRAMFVTVLAAYAEADIDNNAPAFSDTGAGKWYTGAAAWASEMEIVKGIGDGRFAPNRAITRQDLCTMLYKYLKAAKIQLKADSDRTYADYNSVAAYAKEAVGFCAASGLVTGFEDSSFRPRSTATRAQVAQILMRLDMLRKGQELPDEPMPAQSFDGEAGEDMSVAVNAPEGALPENTKMTVSRVTDEAALAAIKEKVCTDVLAAADITFTKDGAELEPSADVEVQISLDGLENIQNPTVVHVRPDGNVEYIEAELVNTNRSGSEKALRFYARDFSVYAVISGDDNPFYNVTVNFYVRKNNEAGPSANASDWELINKQIIRSNQIEAAKDNDTVLIYDPGVPNLNANQSFEGWWRENSFDENTEGMSVEYMNAKIKQDYKDGTIATERNLYAMVYNVVYVEFHDQAGAVLRTDYHHVTDSQRYLINMTYTPFKDNQNFTGWVTRKDVLTLGDYPTYEANPDPVIRNNTEYTVTETLELYPYLQEGYWLIYDPNIANNDSDPTKCEYKGPDFVPKGTLTAPPTFKNEHPRPGYELEGWYTDPTLRNRYTFGQALTKDTTLYAKWTPIEAKYLVVFVVQNADDPTKYDYYDSVSRNWRYDSGKVNTKSGDMVSAYTAGSTMNDSLLASVDLTGATYYSADKTIAKLGQYYEYSTEKNSGNSVLVRGDGSTVLRVYYDRKTVTMRYWAGTYSRSDSNVYYDYDTYGTARLDTARHYFLRNSSTGEYIHCVASGTATGSTGRYIYSSGAILTDDDGNTYNFSDYYVYVYVRGTTSNTKIAEFTGLYGAKLTDAQLAQVDVDYPYEYCFQSTTSGSYVLYGVPDEFTNPGASYGGSTYTFDYFMTTTPRALREKTINYISQDPESETGVWMMNTPIYTPTCTNSINRIVGDVVGRTFIGYNLARNSMSTSQGYVSLGESGGQEYTFDVDDITGEAAYAYFKLNHYQLAFQSNGSVVKERTLPYGRKLARYSHVDDDADKALFVPDNGPEGYYFEGWYTDDSYQKPFKFDGTMPAHAVTLYAKWTMIRYRVFLDYAGSDSEAQITFPDGTYSSTWRLDYGEQVDENRIANVTRDGWVLLGWYLDPEYKHAFNFSMGANDSMVYGDEAYYYGIQMPGESDEAYAARMNGSTRRGTDPLSGNAWDDTWDTDWETHDYSGEYETAGYESADKMRTARGEQHNVVHTIRLYAKWRQDPKGTVGIRVNYLGDNLPSTGYFNVNDRPHEWLDPEAYVDRADAYAQAASVPEIQGEQFLYWEILKPVRDSNGDYVVENDTVKMEPTGRRVYPGQTWQVRLEEAHEERVPVANPNCDHSSVSAVSARPATCTENGCEAHWVCNLCGKCFSDEAHTTEINPTIPATGHTWGEWQYQQSGQGGHYHICSVCNAKAGGAHVMEQTAYTAPTTTSEGSKTETCTVCGYSKTTTLPMLQGYTVSFSVPAGVTQPADQTGLEDGASITLPTEPAGTPSGYIFKGWVTGPVAETTAQPADIQAGGSSYTVHADTVLYALYTKGTDQVIYQLADHFTDGGKFIIVAQSSISGTTGYAVSNAIRTSDGHYLQRSAVTISGNTCTSSDAASVLWVAAGSDANGWTLYNEAVQKYMGLDSTEYLNLTDSGLAWKYTADKWLDNQIDSESFYYLSYKTNNVATPYYTTGKSGQNTYPTNLYQEILPTYTTEIEGSSVEPESRSVKYFVNGVQVGSTLTVEDGSSVTVGDGITVTAPADMTFTGYWVTAQGTNVNYDTVTKYAHGSASYTVNGADVNFYALFSQGIGGTSSTKWTKATAVPAAGTEFIIAYGTSALQNAARGSNRAALPSTSFTTEDGCIVTSDDSASGLDVSGHTFVLVNNQTGTLIQSTVSTSTMYIHFNYSSGSRRIAIATYTSNSYVDVAASGNGFTVIGNATANSWSSNTDRCLSTDFTNSNTAGVLDFYVQTTVQSGGTTTYTTGTQVSGGNAVTEPEESVDARPATEPKTRIAELAETVAPADGIQSVTPSAPVGDTSYVWEPVDTITSGEEYLIGYTDSSTNKTYLLMSYNPATGKYYTSASLTGYNATKVCYAIPAVLDSNGYVTGVDTTNFNGATLEHTAWKINYVSSTSKYNIQSVYNNNYYLRVNSDSTSSSTDLQLYPDTRNSTWNDYWVWDSSTHYLSHYYSSTYLRKYISCLVGSDDTTVTSFDADADSDYALPLTLFQKTEQTAQTYTLTIHYQFADGSQAYEDYVGQYEAGAPYEVQSPTIGGFTPSEPLVSGNMPSGDHSRTVVYTANTVSNERWAPTQEIVPGEDYLIAYVLNGKPYLLVNYNGSAADHYGLSFSYGTSNTGYLGYLAPATVATEDGTEYVVGVNGAASDLQYCHWIFSDSDGGTITSGYESERSLLWGGNTGGPAGVYPASSGDTWKWTPNTNDNMGSMTNTWVSTNTYVMYFYPCTASGTASITTTAPYAGVSRTAFTNVRLYKKLVEEGESTWKVSFVDEDGVSMADEGYPSYETTDGSTVTRPTDPQREDYYFLGWFYKNSEGQEVQYNFGEEVHDDLTLIAHFLYAWEVQYTVTLRAVYGMKNTTGTTHIYWYANDGTTAGFGEGAGDRYEQTDLTMNLPYNIPTPTTWTGKATNGKLPEIEHRVFLGWARMPTIGSGVTGTEHPELTEEDLYLKWNAAEGKYEYLPSSDKLTSADIGNADPDVWTEVTQVYADESQPYHDFYAVWASYAYVFHSASGKLEAVEITRTDGVKDTVDLVNKVPSDCLYGGYYTDFGGVKNVTAAASMQSAQRASVENAYSVDHVGGSVDRLVAVNGAETYDGSKAKTQNNQYRFWERKNAYGAGDQAAAPSGLKVVPELGTVYYLKEVPQAYLTPKYIYTYDTLNGNVIQDFYMLTLVDDNLYSNVGFRTKNGATTVEQAAEGEWISKQTLAGYFSITQNGSSDGSTPPATATVNAASFGLDSGFVAFTKQNSLIQEDASFTLMPSWITLDGVDVNSRGTLKLTVDEGKTKITGESLPGTLPVVYSRIYVDTSAPILDANTNPQTVWETANAQTKLYFFNNSNSGSKWVSMTKTDDNRYVASIPSGDWTHVIVVRWNPAVEQQEDDPWAGKWTQTIDIPMESDKNLITLYNSWTDGKLNASFTGVYNP